MNELERILRELGVIPERASRADADAYTNNFQHALTAVKRTAYAQRYVALRGRQLAPPSTDQADPGDEWIEYEEMDEVGAAQLIANYGDDLPLVDVFYRPTRSKIEGYGIGYQYTVQDARRAARSGRPLVASKATAARKAYEYKVENLIAYGDSAVGIKGMLNHANIGLIVPVYGNWTTPARTGLEILKDMLYIVAAYTTNSKQTSVPTDWVFPINVFNVLNTKLVTTTGDTSKTVIKAFQEACPYNIEISAWDKCTNADAAGTGPRSMLYERSADVMTFEEPVPWEQYPPQAKNLAFKVPCHGRIGGIILYRSFGASYIDGI